MSTYTLVPNAAALNLNGAAWGEVGGTVAGGILSDAVSSTYLNLYTAAADAAFIPFTTKAIPANEYVLSASCTGTSQRSLGNSYVQGIPAIQTGSPPAFSQVSLGVTAGFCRAASLTQASSGSGTKTSAWTQADVDALGVYLKVDAPSTTSRYQITELSIALATASIPVAPVISGPTGTVGDTSQPTVRWAHTDRLSRTITAWAVVSNVLTVTTSGNHGFLAGQAVQVAGSGNATVDGGFAAIATVPTLNTYTVPLVLANTSGSVGTTWIGDDKTQQTYQMRVFTTAQAAIGGFDPASSPSTYDSGESIAGALFVTSGSSAQSATIRTNLANGTYVAYVRTGFYIVPPVGAHQVGFTFVPATPGIVAWGAWASSAWTQALTPPVAPTFTAAWNAGACRVDLSATGTANMADANTSGFEVSTGLWAARTNCTITRSTAQFAAGTASGLITPTAAGNCVIATPIGTAGYPVVPTQQVTASMLTRAGISARTIRVDLEWYNAAGTIIGGASTGAGAADNTSLFNQLSSVTATAPAGAAFFAVVVNVLAASGATDIHYIDQAMFAPGTTTAWSVGGLTAFGMLIERSIDGGVTWVTVRPTATDVAATIGQVVPAYSQAYALADYEAPRGMANVRYRATEYATSAGGQISSPSTTQLVTTTNDGAWWIKAVGNPALNRAAARVLIDPKETHSENSGVFRADGRTDPIVVTGQTFGDDIALEVYTSNAAEWEAIKALCVTYQATLLLQEPFVDSAGVGLQRYIQIVGDRTWTKSGTAGAPRRTVSCSALEVGRGY